jgi:hypothetical protein
MMAGSVGFALPVPHYPTRLEPDPKAYRPKRLMILIPGIPS